MKGYLAILSNYSQKAGKLTASTFNIQFSAASGVIRRLIAWSQEPDSPERNCLQGLLLEPSQVTESEDSDLVVSVSLMFHPLATTEMKRNCALFLELGHLPTLQEVNKPQSTHDWYNVWPLTL